MNAWIVVCRIILSIRCPNSAHNICTMLINEVSSTEKGIIINCQRRLFVTLCFNLMLLPFFEGHSSTFLKRIICPLLYLIYCDMQQNILKRYPLLVDVRSCHTLIHPFILIKQNILGNYCQHESFWIWIISCYIQRLKLDSI